MFASNWNKCEENAVIEIRKDREPRRLLQYRQQQGASYEEMDREVKEELLEQLLEEQGHLCAYCMRRIPEKRTLPESVPAVTIEHWLPRNPQDHENFGQGLDYKNMFAVCSGNRGCGDRKKMTCDAYRGNVPLKVNPCDAETLCGITYTSSGRIQSSNAEIDEDLNKRLNLNCEKISLPENRKRALQTMIEETRKECGKGNITLYCKRKLEKIRDAKDPKIPYVGILIWWLEKKIKRHKD